MADFESHYNENSKFKNLCKIQQDYTAECIQEMVYQTEASNDTLQKQIISQKMLENLINDLLDLAKLENNSFTLNSEYFDLTDVIEQSF